MHAGLLKITLFWYKNFYATFSRRSTERLASITLIDYYYPSKSRWNNSAGDTTSYKIKSILTLISFTLQKVLECWKCHNKLVYNVKSKYVQCCFCTSVNAIITPEEQQVIIFSTLFCNFSSILNHPIEIGNHYQLYGLQSELESQCQRFGS